MGLWSEIQRTLLLGTERVGLPGLVRQAIRDHKLSDQGTDAHRLLRILTYLQQMQKGAQRLPQLEAPIPQAPIETQKKASPRQALILKKILEEEVLMEVFPEYLQRSLETHTLIPNDALASICTAYQEDLDLLPMLQELMGTRGQWLARQNPDWAIFRKGSTEDTWNFGTLVERKYHLRSLRNTDPNRATQILKDSWADLPKHQGIPLLALLRENLNSADLPFLEKLLSDADPLLRKTAGRLLLNTPGAELLDEIHLLARRIFPLNIEGALEPISNLKIEDLGESILNIGFSAKAEESERNQLLALQRYLLSILPPVIWETIWERPPTACLSILEETPQGGVYRSDLAESILFYQDVPWSKALLKPLLEAPLKDWDFPALKKLATNLSPQVFDELCVPFLNHHNNLIEASSLIYFILLHHQTAWPVELTLRLIQIFQDYLQYSKPSFQDEAGHYEDLLMRMAVKSEASLVTQLQLGWPHSSFQWHRWEGHVQKMIRILLMRQKMHEAFED